jgi:hypothetical protein
VKIRKIEIFDEKTFAFDLSFSEGILIPLKKKMKVLFFKF